MWLRWAICLGLLPTAATSGEPHRLSCALVRFYVAKYSAPAAEQYARSKGATDAEIETARHCLKADPVQTTSFQPNTSH
jgi:hypothetical protein